MGKSILIIDTPSSCEECPFMCYSNMAMTCRPQKYKMVEDGMECPLKPMPLRKNNQESVMVGSIDMDIGYILGWNACLDEIMGETE